jgi:phage regulator Rha-like protein
MDIIKIDDIRDKIITLRNTPVIIDSDVAALYGVETRDINKAVKNNPEKFPTGYIFELQSAEKQDVVENFHHLSNLKFSPVTPKAFTEKGLYMLATILKSAKATQTTIQIVETFAQIRELAQTVAKMSETTDEFQQKSLLQKSGEIFSDILGQGMETTENETSIELNLAVLKMKHTFTRKKTDGKS